ncbi:MAG: DUF2182 domain-containing protein [Rhodothermia bacterium]|nr:MAG: DUF2182 domain-containing protein [Rhodothermia bacterium]
MSLSARLPRRDALAIVFSLVGITSLAWLYLVFVADQMSNPIRVGISAMQIPAWDAAYFVSMYLMWAIMMIGMMVPSVAPAVLIYAGIVRKAESRDQTVAPTGAFVAGYLTIWILFSLLATSAQWGLASAALVSPMMVSSSKWLSAGLLLSAGVYQWLPIKNQCLHQCRSPIEYISARWRKGYAGAVRMGIGHGLYCLGCCWVLMALLFVGGVMNLLWIAAIAVYVLIEKVLPFGEITARVMGVLTIVAAVVLLTMG